MKFKVGEIWKSKSGLLYKIYYAGEEGLYPLQAINLKYNDMDYFTKEGKFRANEITVYDLSEKLSKEDYPEYYI